MGREQNQDLLTQEVCDVTSEEQKFTCQGDKIAPVKNTGLYVTASGKYCKFNITKRYEISIIAVRSLGFNTMFANFPPPPPNVPNDIMVIISISITTSTCIRIRQNADREGCYWQRWIAPSEICITLQIIRKPNPIVVSLLI